MLAVDLGEKTGKTPEAMGADHTYEWKDLVAETKEGQSNTAANKEYDINSAAAWAHMDLCEALAPAEARRNNWSQKIRWTLKPASIKSWTCWITPSGSERA